jgi:hypothetical protein
LPERKAAEMAVKCQKNVFLTVRDQGETKIKQPGGLFYRSFSAQSREYRRLGRAKVARRPCDWGEQALCSSEFVLCANSVTPTKTKAGIRLLFSYSTTNFPETISFFSICDIMETVNKNTTKQRRYLCRFPSF